VPFASGDNLLVARGKGLEDRLTIHMDVVPAKLSSAPFTELAVNVGGRAQYAPRSGPVWIGDQPYRAGGFGWLGAASKGEMFNKDLAILHSADTPLYFDYRSGLEGYRFDVPDGEYELELLFAEPGAEPGARVFDVGVNGRAVVRGLDLAAQYGVAEAVPLRFAASARGGQGVTVTFGATAGQPILNAIRLRKTR
jgi:beta-galactosidase